MSFYSPVYFLTTASEGELIPSQTIYGVKEIKVHSYTIEGGSTAAAPYFFNFTPRSGSVIRADNTGIRLSQTKIPLGLPLLFSNTNETHIYSLPLTLYTSHNRVKGSDIERIEFEIVDRTGAPATFTSIFITFMMHTMLENHYDQQGFDFLRQSVGEVQKISHRDVI